MEAWTGILNMDVENRKGKTVAKNVYFQGAFKVMRPVYHDDSGQVCYYLLNPGGGYLDGDRYRMQITLEKDSRLTLTTQSATKIYKTPKKFAYQEADVFLKEGSYLEYIPDPLIAYRHARYKQKNVFRLEKGATLFYSDIITPGWSPEDELFSYDLLQLINEIYVDDDLVVYDHIKMDPKNQNMNALGIMEGFSHLGSMIVIGEHTSHDFLDRLYRDIHTDRNDYIIGISLLPVPGFTVRILANSTQLIEGIFADYHHIISEEWFKKKPSFLRKY
ncbi:urease accessory protein UreD [Lederbergia wuyishanensis]|uniref:Urease accessory protein UreD n=1 Tax=Lederbergia wuyishanensis TaxID=1347903 RepID=A0ABU0D5E6_9BACI|nr:urease accessory protein UreD [Lederbergia wuyishanensis]MCJ8009776.1 urease accessory protein UreD [Lederbergia wuyishanensis]MDQ0343632.1 urease accessory protein [Lederbergia wuyishanensis]